MVSLVILSERLTACIGIRSAAVLQGTQMKRPIRNSRAEISPPVLNAAGYIGRLEYLA